MRPGWHQQSHRTYLPSPLPNTSRHRAICISRSEISIHGRRQFIESVHLAACHWPISPSRPCITIYSCCISQLCTNSIQMAIGRGRLRRHRTRDQGQALNSSVGQPRTILTSAFVTPPRRHRPLIGLPATLDSKPALALPWKKEERVVASE